MRVIRAALASALLMSTVACAYQEHSPSAPVPLTPSPAPSSIYPANVVHLDGIGAVRFGNDRDDLVARGLVQAGEPSCDGSPVYDVPGYVDAADLIFNAQRKLAFVWVLSPGVHTPEKLTVDSSVDAVRAAYPGAEELTANERSFPGVLVKGGKTAYLFLYEPNTGQVIKLLAGYTDILREGQRAGITC